MSSAPATSEWTQRRERGSLPLLRFMVWVSLSLGRRISRMLLRLIAAYFLLFGAAARRQSSRFLERALGRKPTLAERYRLFFNFASTVHDRVYFIKGRFELFDIRLYGAGHFNEHGTLLMGAHLGSFEAMRACGKHLAHRHVVMAMFPDNARRLNSVLTAIEPTALQDVVPLGRMDSMLELGARLDDGALVGVLADRRLGDEPTLAIPFLGHPAPFVIGPMRMAAALRRRVIFMTGLYRGGNRYEIHFEPLADFSNLDGASRAEREARVHEAIGAYASRLEGFAQQAPDNWFNFHDFWADAQ